MPRFRLKFLGLKHLNGDYKIFYTVLFLTPDSTCTSKLAKITRCDRKKAGPETPKLDLSAQTQLISNNGWFLNIC